MKHNTLFLALIPLLSLLQAQAQIQEHISKAPKLIVAVTIDCFRGDYLQYCLHTFGPGGFKRLFNDGLVYSNLAFDYPNVTTASAIATIFTGTNPCYNGIPADTRYDFDTLLELPILHDPNYLGNYTNETLSPKALVSSTIADELKIATNGQSLIYAIAPDAIQAILSGGHAANAAFWIENYNGKWATSTCYNDIPWYVEQTNINQSVAEKIDTCRWKPALPAYHAFPYTQHTTPFTHHFYGKHKFLQFKTSPHVNTEITTLCEKFLQYSNYEKRSSPSMLSLTYYAGNYRETPDKEFSCEIQDTYYRLDKEIERLLALIDKYTGLNNTVLFIASTGHFHTPDINPNIIPPAGNFYPNRCVALLNIYLMSIYGQGDWVTGYYKNQIYLNRKQIDNKQIPIADIQRKAAEFAIQFSGIQDVSTLIETQYGNWNESVARFRNGIYAGIAGDIILELKPGWILIDEKDPRQNTPVRNNTVIAPLIFFGQEIVPQRLFKTVKATQIAPTVTHILRIRPPNAATELPLAEFL
jgi:hypothetical protein